MASETVPVKDSHFGPWLINFAAVAAENASELNLSPDQVASMAALSANFKVAFNENLAAKAKARGKAATKRQVRRECEDLFRDIARVITANNQISNDLKGKLQLKVTRSTRGPVVPVIDFNAHALSSGIHLLKWNRNGNSEGTTFLIEACDAISNTWRLIDVTTRTRYRHTGQTPGVQVVYRIISQRANVKSSPSNLAIVYSSQEVGAIKGSLAA